MKGIKLTNTDKVALVDDQNFDWLNQWKWGLSPNGYAVRCKYVSPKNLTILMHREVLKTPEGFDTDHINRDKLDNRVSNLRIATRSQNMLNSEISVANTSGFKGVHYYKSRDTYQVYIHLNGKRTHLGYFKNIEQAAAVYQEASKIHMDQIKDK